MAGNIKGITIEIGGSTTKLDQALKGVNTTARSLQNELKAVNQALKLDPKNVEAAERKQKLLTEAVANTKEKLETLKTAQEQAQAAFERGEMGEDKYRALETEIQKTENELKSLENELDSCGGKWDAYGQKLQAAGDKMQKVGDGMQNAGRALMPVTTAITGVGAASVAAAVDFEDAIAKLSTIADTSKETGVPIETLEQQIKDLSDQTGISASEIADNVYNAISAGQQTGDAVNFVANATKLATAGFAESGASLDLLTTIMNAYGMEADKVNHVSDVLINTQNLGKTTVAELSSAMGKVIPTANASNVSLENLAAGYSIMTANGIATAESTTYMNSMLNELSKSGTKASDAIKNKTGKSFQELMADGASLADVLDILQQTANENGVAMGDMFGSAEAGKAALVLLKDGADGFNETLDSMVNCTGATDEAFGKLDTTSRNVKIALNQIKNTAIELGTTILEMVMPYVQQILDKIKDFTTWFKNLDESQKKLIVKIGAIVAAIAPALLIGGKVISGIGKITSGVGGLVTKIGGLIAKAGGLGAALSAALPVVAIVAAVAAIVAAFVHLYKTNDEFREKVNNTVAKVKEAFGQMVEKIKPLLESLKQAFNSLLQALQPIFELWLAYIERLVSGIMAAAPSIIAAVTNVVEFITNIVNALVALLHGDFEGFFTYIKAAWQNVINFIKNILTAWASFLSTFFSGVWTAIQNIFSTVGTWFQTMFTTAYNNIVNAFKNIGQWFAARWTDIKNALSTVATWFLTMFQNAYNNVVNVFKAIGQWFAARWTDIKNALSTVASWFQTMFNNAYQNIVNIFKGIGQWFAARWTDIKNVFANVATFFSEKFNAAATAIKNAFSSIPQFFTDLWSKITGIFKDAGQKVADGVMGAFKSACNSVFGTIENIVNGFINAINAVIGTINEIPGVSIGKLSTVSLPRLAKGGILSKGQAIVGEAGAELLTVANGRAIVTPLSDKNRSDTLQQAAGGRGDFIQNNYIQSPKALSPYEVGRQTRNQTRNMVLALQKG